MLEIIIMDFWWNDIEFQTEELKEKGGEEHGALVQQILETQKELEEPKKKTIGGVEIVTNWMEYRYISKVH